MGKPMDDGVEAPEKAETTASPATQPAPAQADAQPTSTPAPAKEG